jgi:2-iminobutanoate/2-iminopropanoate deaminase
MRSFPPMSEIVRTLKVPDVPDATGPWARAVEWNGMVFLSGVRGLDPATGRPAETLEARIRLIFDHIDKTLRHHGASFATVLVTRVYVTDMARIRPLINDAYVAAFGGAWPTRTILEVAGLNQDDDVEVEVVAARQAAS